ncbi:hypothetical protein WU67_15300 [Lactiplantibacillus plantarum]|nr:hypothetical protein WU67_15300 [Lactiplantibacillus plantarum]
MRPKKVINTYHFLKHPNEKCHILNQVILKNVLYLKTHKYIKLLKRDFYITIIIVDITLMLINTFLSFDYLNVLRDFILIGLDRDI